MRELLSKQNNWIQLILVCFGIFTMIMLTANYGISSFVMRRADAILEVITDGIFILRGNDIIYLNPVAEKVLGMKLRDFRKNSKDSSQKISRSDSVITSLKKAITCSLPVELAIEIDERKHYYLMQAYPCNWGLVSDRFQASQLVLAQDITLFKESQEAKSHFLATLSHEIKTPVTSLTLATRLLKKSLDEQQSPIYRTLILSCADDVDRLRTLLDDFVAVSNFDILAQNLTIKKIDFGKLCLHSIQSFQIQSREREIELTHQIITHGKPILVQMDATKIAWALSNLITNALRHTPRGGKVSVQIETVHDSVEVSVKDSGPGIEKRRQERIFDKFNSYYDLRIARSGSIGAGLAIAREIVVAHGGRIWVVSEVGHGSEFHFTLPLQRTNVAPSVDEGILTQHATRGLGRGSGKNGFSL